MMKIMIVLPVANNLDGLGWSQIGIRSKFIRFDSKICDSIDSKGQNIFEKFNENWFEIRSIRFDSNYRVESNFSDAGFVRNSFDSIRKFMIRLIRKVKNNSKNSIKINSKFVRFDSTPPLRWSGKYFYLLRKKEI